MCIDNGLLNIYIVEQWVLIDIFFLIQKGYWRVGGGVVH